MIRQFSFLRPSGERLSLNAPDEIFLENPQGLGLSFTVDTYSLGDGFFVAPSVQAEQVLFQGELIFVNDGTAYERYESATNWLLTSESLTLLYQPYSGAMYYRDVKLERVEKSEITGISLVCPVSFVTLTPWYTPTSHKFALSFTAEGAAGKRYAYRYSYRYIEDHPAGTISVDVGGQLPGAVRITLYGLMQSPKVTVTDRLTGEVYGVIDLTGVVLNAGDSLVISSVRHNQGVWINGTNIIDRVELYDSVPLFPQLPPGRSVIIAVETTTVQQTDVGIVNVYEYYRTR